MSHKAKTLFSFILFTTVICLKPQIILAQVAINEVNPTPSSGNDWIELFNLTNQDINLAGWTVEDSSSALTTNPNLTNQILSAHGFLVIEVSNRLNNTGDQVKLKNPAGQQLDFFEYTQTSIDQSWARIPDGTGSFVLTAATRGIANSPNSTATPTPSASPNSSSSPAPSPSSLPSPNPSPSLTVSPTPTPKPTPTPSQTPSPQPSPTLDPATLPTHIILSEIMACPNTGEPEWVELQNLDSVPYSLMNWQIKDSQNNSRYFTAQISAQGLIVIQITPAMLNNTGGDQVSIIRPDGVTTSWASYATCVKGKSLIFNGEGWVAADPTPGAGNPDLSAPPDNSDSLDLLVPNASTPDDSLSESSPASSQATPSAQGSLDSDSSTQTLSSPSDPLSSSTDSALHFSNEGADSPPVPLPNLNSPFSNSNQASPSSIALAFIFGSAIILWLNSAWFLHAWYTKKREEPTFNFE